MFTQAVGISRRHLSLSVCVSVTHRYCITSNSDVADKPTRRTASRQTENSHVTITTPFLLVICRPVVRIHIA